MGDETGGVALRYDGPVAILTIDNPPLNALSHALIDALGVHVASLATDEAARVVVVTAKGDRAFSGGANVKEFPGIMRPGTARDYAAHIQGIFTQLGLLPQPTIAALNGFAYGGGMELAMSCDLRIAAAHAVFGQPEIKLGLIPGAGGTQRLARLLGAARAKELLYLGDEIDAGEALRLGLVTKVVSTGEALPAALALAHSIASRPAPALRLIKRAVDEGLALPLMEGLALERELFESAFQTQDVKEGVAAFLERRTPKFIHR